MFNHLRVISIRELLTDFKTQYNIYFIFSCLFLTYLLVLTWDVRWQLEYVYNSFLCSNGNLTLKPSVQSNSCNDIIIRL